MNEKQLAAIKAEAWLSLTASVERLQRENAALTAERDSAVMVQHTTSAMLKKALSERDFLAQQLQQERDAAARHAAYVSACVDSDGCYRP